MYVQRASTKNLHFDRDIPFSKLGSARVLRVEFGAMSNYSLLPDRSERSIALRET